MSNVKYSIQFDQKKGKYLIATDHIYIGDKIFEEIPLICSQFLWNAECKYQACQYCLSPLENAEENVSRLIKNQINLPYMKQCCQIDKTKHCQCQCGEKYCSADCLQKAYQIYHRFLCPKEISSEISTNLEKLCQLWKSIHYPPETASIMLLVKILILAKQDLNFIKKLQQFSCNTIEESERFIHKLCGDQFREQIHVLQKLFINIFKNDEILKPFLTDDGFKSLLALIGKNSQGIGTSSFSKWAENVERFLVNNPEELLKINKLIEELFEKMEQITGLTFINNEGSGLFELHSNLNHSCEPNSEVCFPQNNFLLQLKAKKNIEPGEEINICYLDECWQQRSRHSRQKFLQENYLFKCECLKCQQQINDPDVTSDEEEDEDEDEDLNSDQNDNDNDDNEDCAMNCD